MSKIFCGKSKTRQEMKKECDINYLMQNFQRKGVIPKPDINPIYADFSNPIDYMAAVDLQLKAVAQFESLDSKFRESLGNDPVKFLEYVNNPDNIEDMVKRGLAIKKEVAPVEPPKEPPKE